MQETFNVFFESLIVFLSSYIKDYRYHPFPTTEFSYCLSIDTRQYELPNYLLKIGGHWPLKGRYDVIFMQPSMANLNSPSSRVVKDSTPFRRRIFRCKNFGKGESWPSLFLDVVNLYLIKFRHRWILNERTFYSFIILFIWKWILT